MGAIVANYVCLGEGIRIFQTDLAQSGYNGSGTTGHRAVYSGWNPSKEPAKEIQVRTTAHGIPAHGVDSRPLT